MIQYETQSAPTTLAEAWARVALRWGLTPWQITQIKSYRDLSVAANQARGEVAQLITTHNIHNGHS